MPVTVEFVGATSGNGAAATPTSFNTSFHANWLPGDTALLSGHVSATSLTMSVPGTWADALAGLPINQSTNSRAYVWARRLAVGDTAPTITNSGSVTGGWTMLIFRGASGLIGQASSATAGAATSINNASLTGVLAGSALASFQHARVASGTIPSGFTPPGTYTEPTNGDHATSRVTTGANMRMEAAYRLISTAGNYGGDTFSVTNSISSSIVSIHIELLAASDALRQLLRPRLGALIQM